MPVRIREQASKASRRKEKILWQQVLVPLLICGTIQLLQNLVPPAGHAEHFSVESSAGYDDNPAQTNDRKGSGFTFHRASMFDSWQLGGGASFTGLLEGSYQNYTRVGDNYFLKARGELERPVLGGRLVPALFLETNAYRDDYIREDDRDQYLAGMRLSWLFSRHMTFSLEGACSRLNYKHAAYSYAEPSGSTAAAAGLSSLTGMTRNLISAGSRVGTLVARRNRKSKAYGGGGPGYPRGTRGGQEALPANNVPGAGGGSGSGSGFDLQDLSVKKTSRNDHLANGDFICDLFLTPTVYGTVTAGYARLHSTDNFETYRQLHAHASLMWDFAAAWRVQLEAGLWRTAYDESPLRMKRTDKTFSAGAQLSRFFGPVEVYGKTFWLKNNSKVNSEFYHQMVTQCGFSLYF